MSPVSYTHLDVYKRQDLVYGPQGADHQLTTTATGRTSSWLYLDRQRTVRALSLIHI